MESLAEAWPGTPEYKKKFGSSDDGSEGSRHKIERSAGITRATRKYDSESGESEEPTKSREDAAAAPVKRGRGRPPGKYGSYKKKVKESIEILEALETDEEIEEFVFSLDEESFAELEQYLSEEQLDEAATPVKTTPGISVKKEKGRTRAITTHHVVDGKHYKVTSQHDGDDGLYHDIHKVSGKKETRVHGSYTHGLGGYDSPPKSHREGSLDKKVASSLYSAHNKERKKKVHGDEGKHPHELHDDDDFYESFMVGQEYKEQVDEAMSHQAKTTMKHVKNATPGEKKAAKDIKPGIAGYRDRVAMLKSAEARGGLKEEETVTEGSGPKEKQKTPYRDINSPASRAAADQQRKKMAKDAAAAPGKKLLGKIAAKNENEEVDEALKHPNHKVLDKNKNNKLDREDFAILRGEKKAPMKEAEATAEDVANIAAFITKQSKGEA